MKHCLNLARKDSHRFTSTINALSNNNGMNRIAVPVNYEPKLFDSIFSFLYFRVLSGLEPSLILVQVLYVS